ncbi:MAG: DNA-binding protein [Fibrobacteres bacterium CG2_30_45_31]|nr:MAG: DNA-binding protein [Fibrobacteres bacterium CG2_30_45_31]
MHMNEITAFENVQGIKQRIYMVRGVQVMLDSDLSELYQVETKQLNQAVNRNLERFPDTFHFQLTLSEVESLRCQIGTSNQDSSLRSQIVTSKTGRGGRRYLPYAFTEQGVAMLSAVLRSEVAVRVSIQIINAFVEMRSFIQSNASLFQRIDAVEHKQQITDQKVNDLFLAMDEGKLPPKQGIFYDGQVFDAHAFVSKLVKSAKHSIVLIDNYIDESVLVLFSKRSKNVALTLLTKQVSSKLELDVRKFNEQYPPIEVRQFTKAHDRFMIIDGKAVYHIGASLKDLGKKWFAFSKMDVAALEMLQAAGVMG